MRIQVKFYAKYRDFSGKQMDTFELDGKYLKDILDIIKESYPKFRNENIHLIAVNGKFVKDLNAEIKDGDVISLFPPVSGG